ncbi:hypothetical protein GCM10007874_49290 [Labrys miyagiensis]|uniref:Uncharacterized protein n=2 Tax=Labrys miyagiensis TaxID=346912 RepID=A0ABQ6CUI6_9HYPH|nr:hypothetical protein GCM10007874_49290 [Labrys miyagiensis]
MVIRLAMTAIPLYAYTATSEHAAARSAAKTIVDALAVATGTPAICEPVFVESLEALAQSPPGSIRLASLLPEIDRVDDAWDEVQARLRVSFGNLAATGNPVFICTVVRIAGDGEDADLLYRRRVRIRRLDLLAAELSRETGAFVIDLDRVIADIGGRNLQTDYRLDTAAAASVAGHAIAIGLIVNGLDEFVPFELQDKLREILMQKNVGPATPSSLVPANVMAFGRGRHKQNVVTITDSDGGSQAGRLLRQALRREIAPGEAFAKLMKAVRSRGAVESGTLLASAVLRMVRSHRR